eukprot:TRINITY_DN5205_c1_g1_i1.p1 TRINITY_DN5205_c1_g1~~TRINITY_DN5205_c1_g1_i1.p1  ORF type:complete len:623 (-),score=148.70 TRINITY_DN5205_c1_g1_i1:133-2001(-)
MERSSMERCATILQHLHHCAVQNLQAANCVNLINNEPRIQEKVRWNGWGYADTEFALDNGLVYLTGSRYQFSGYELPHLSPFIQEIMGVDPVVTTPSRPAPTSFPDPVQNYDFLSEIDGCYNNISFDGMDRLYHAHGHTAQEIYSLRYDTDKDRRIPDVVVYPRKHKDVVKIVNAANTHNVVIIPYGGGTSVSSALIPPQLETRMIVSLDMHDMDKIKWIDSDNLVACIEAGIVGVELARKLEDIGYTLGHEPDSMEFSTLGGWIATRASGMKKNTYGNIEQLLVKATMVTPAGVLEKSVQVPRISSGPDVNEIILGSEGIFGVITEAVVKLQPLPECKIFGALAFPNFESGVRFMRDVAYYRCQPASIRLVDPEQFRFGHALKPKNTGLLTPFFDAIKKAYVTKYHKFNLEELCAATLLFEGTKEVVDLQQKQIYRLAKKHGGIKADAESGKRGYQLTFMIAYIRDLAFQCGIMGESFETSVPWSKTLMTCRRVKERIRQTARELKVPGVPFVSCRVTQTYDVGACIYFYFGIQFEGLNDPIQKFYQIENSAREEILSCGGSISHHHGVGKHRKKFLGQMIGEEGVNILKGVKSTVDPKNIFANANLFDVEGAEPDNHHLF